MNCIKCGRELEAEGVFCLACLPAMKDYPVKPGTAVQLPRRGVETPYRRPYPRRRPLTQEEQLMKAKRQLRSVTLALILALLIAAALAYPAFRYVMADKRFSPGQNYSAMSDLIGAQTP